MASDPTNGAEKLVYANWIRIGGTPFDFAIDFGYNSEPGPLEEYPVRVVMSWENAHALARLVTSALEEYEGQVGEIRTVGEVTDGDD